MTAMRPDWGLAKRREVFTVIMTGTAYASALSGGVPMFERVIDDVEAQKTCETVLGDVESRRGSVVVKRNGEPFAAVIPIELYHPWNSGREPFLDHLEATAARANVPGDEATKLAVEAQRSVGMALSVSCRAHASG